MIKTFQYQAFLKRLRKTFEELETILYDDHNIIIDDFTIGYRLITLDVDTNYSFSNNILYINPKDIENPIRLNIMIKMALRYRKRAIPWH